MNDLAETLEQFSARMDALERRVLELEKGSATPAQAVNPVEQMAATPVVTPDLPCGEQISGALLIFGKSMLGIAGAYLLRALAEAGVLPRLLLATLAIAYAIAWLIAASRTSSRKSLGPILYAATSVLILAPMLWELTMRFRVLTPIASAGVLALFVAASTVLNWRNDRAPDFAVACISAALTALALSVATHETMEFSGLLLAMFALCEYRSLHNARQGLRIWVAGVNDCIVWLLIVIYHNPPDARADYPSLGTLSLSAPASLLLAITTGSVLYRTIILKGTISAFEAIQSVIAFLLWVLTGLFLLPHFSGTWVGLVCLLFAGACYGAAYGLFRHSATRNFHVFALWSAALLLAGILLSLPSSWAIASLAVASVASEFLAVRICCPTLECHGIIYLSVAAVVSGLLAYSFRALVGDMPATAAWSVLLVAGSALACYLPFRQTQSKRWQLKLLHVVPAVLAVAATAALASHGSVRLAALLTDPSASHIAFIRTLILCATALAAAFAGPRWRRPELKPIAYVVLAFIAAKLVFEDLRHGQLGFIAASMFLFALTLIGVPRLARRAESQSRT